MWVAPQTARLPLEAAVVGRKPPWNQPQLTPFAVSMSPTFRPVIAAPGYFVEAQSSYAGSGSLMTVPMPLPSGLATVYASGVAVCCPVVGSTLKTPCVCPETRLSAPGVDGPNVVP